MSLGSQPPTPGSHTAQLSVPNWCGLLLMKMATFWREREREKGKNPLPLLGAELCSREAAGSYHSQLLRGGTARQEAPGTVGVGVRKGQLLHLQQSAGNRDFGYHSTTLRRSDC